MKSRNWIKGHFYQAMGIGLFIGLIGGFTFSFNPPLVAIAFIIVLFLMDSIEKMCYGKQED